MATPLLSLVKTYVNSTQMAARPCMSARLTTSAVHLGTKPAVSMRRAQAKQIMAGTAALPGQKADLQLPKVVEGSLLEAPPVSEARTWDVSCLLHRLCLQQANYLPSLCTGATFVPPLPMSI